MNTQRHILIADGDFEARAALAGELAGAGYIVSQTGSGADAMSLALARTARIDLLLMAVALLDGDGREVVSRLRRRGVGLPVILMSDSAAEDDVVWGLDAGADDFLVRPLRPRELAARLRAHLRTGGSREESELRIGPAVFRPASRTLVHPDVSRPLKLTEKETLLLMRLYRGEGRPVSRQTLLREVWGYSPDATSHTVETHIYRLRRKIEPSPQSPALLVSESGGYRLCIETPPVTSQVWASPAAAGWNVPVVRPTIVQAQAYRVG